MMDLLFKRALCAAVLLLQVSAFAAADNPGDQVIVVYNTRVPESKKVALHYADLRHVPTAQIFGFALSTGSDISRVEFREELQRPLLRKLEDKKLWHMASDVIPATNGQPSHVLWRIKESKIRYAVLCYGVPYRIARDPNLKEAGDDQLKPELRRNEAAVDSELALLPCFEQDLPLAGPLRNPLYGVTNAAVFSPTNGVLMVTRLDGPSADIASGLVDKAMEAEKEGLWGRAYFDLRNIKDPNYRDGDDWIRGAAEICRRLGFETVVDDNPATFPPEFPMSHIAIYCGWYDGQVSGPFTRKNVEFMPGAFAYHLHSFSAANLRSATENWVGPFLAKGATITMGCVAEPYLAGTPNVAIFVSRFIFEGMSFGEAAYASQPVLSWQTVMIGDPLYRPFGRPAQQVHNELVRTHGKFLEWSYLRAVNLNLAQGMPTARAAAFLDQLDLTKHSAVLTEKLGDLYAVGGKPASAIEMYERALKLDPSPEQRVRLRMTLGDRLTAVSTSEDGDKYKEALADYQALLKENPDYPNKLAIYKKLLVVAQHLNDAGEVARYEKEIARLTPTPKEESK